MSQDSQSEEFQHDWYGILDCDKDSTIEQIEKASRKLSFKYHPDKNKDADAPALFLLVQKAKDILLDPVKRKLIDTENKRKADVIAQKARRDERMDKDRKRMRDQFEENLKKASEPKVSHEQLMKNEVRKRQKIIEELARKNASIIEEHTEANQYQQYMKQQEFDRMRQTLHKEGLNASCQIKVKWKRHAEPHTEYSLEQLFGKFGKIEEIKMSETKGTSAVLTYSLESSAKVAVDSYQYANDLQVTLVASKSKSSAFDYKGTNAPDDPTLAREVNRAVGLEALHKALEECRAKFQFGMHPPAAIAVDFTSGGVTRSVPVKQVSIADCYLDKAEYEDVEMTVLRQVRSLSSKH